MVASGGKKLRLLRTIPESARAEADHLRARITELERMLDISGAGRLAAASDRAEDFADTMRGWVWETDIEDRFVYISKGMADVTGMAPEAHYGRTREEIGVRDVLPEDQWQRYHDKIKKRLAFNDFIYPRKVPNGDMWMRTSGKPVYNLSGEFVGYRGTATDVTTEIEATGKITILNGAVTEKENFLATALRTIPDGVKILNHDMELVAWNDQLFKVLDLDKDVILNADDPGLAVHCAFRGCTSDPDDTDAAQRCAHKFDPDDPPRFEHRIASGKWIECRWSPIPGGGTMAIYRDITETRRMMDQLERQASVDMLTGITNRRKFDEMAQEEFSRSSRYDRPLSFILIDIDHFKAINDSFGHAAGDIALRHVAETCKDLLRDCDKLARYGGEEFIAMLPETDAEGAEIVAERMRLGIERMRIDVGSTILSLTASAGACQASALHRSYQDVVAQADEALYLAKERGRNQSVLA